MVTQHLPSYTGSLPQSGLGAQPQGGDALSVLLGGDASSVLLGGDASSVLLGGDASSVLLGGDASSVLLGGDASSMLLEITLLTHLTAQYRPKLK